MRGGVTVRGMVIGAGHVVAALVIVGLVVLAFWRAPRPAAFGLGAALLLLSLFLLNTLILDEPFVEKDLNSNLDAAAMIGVPAVLGVALGVFGLLKHPKSHA